ncbi:hypothetical protein EMEDMD4_500074 [Sinorhizobium medicae]|uniref:Uncharacterized protein n=1 Tax=Sinorhizobium medicae TaxID=110321 RepID=A0A508X124_9HYPH|nr:hypothetical protein EMEDMD4_500074 [Sinorhizobium medicae]
MASEMHALYPEPFQATLQAFAWSVATSAGRGTPRFQVAFAASTKAAILSRSLRSPFGERPVRVGEGIDRPRTDGFDGCPNIVGA